MGNFLKNLSGLEIDCLSRASKRKEEKEEEAKKRCGKKRGGR